MVFPGLLPHTLNTCPTSRTLFWRNPDIAWTFQGCDKFVRRRQLISKESMTMSYFQYISFIYGGSGGGREGAVRGIGNASFNYVVQKYEHCSMIKCPGSGAHLQYGENINST